LRRGRPGHQAGRVRRLHAVQRRRGRAPGQRRLRRQRASYCANLGHMIYAAPSTLFEATVQGAGTGLVGTMGVRIKAVPSGTTVLARTTAGITEVNPGIYTKQL